eukprot:scaffold48575_cov343-Isochrysis_galbana.AAC.2
MAQRIRLARRAASATATLVLHREGDRRQRTAGGVLQPVQRQAHRRTQAAQAAALLAATLSAHAVALPAAACGGVAANPMGTARVEQHYSRAVRKLDGPASLGLAPWTACSRLPSWCPAHRHAFTISGPVRDLARFFLPISAPAAVHPRPSDGLAILLGAARAWRWHWQPSQTAGRRHARRHAARRPRLRIHRIAI